jgi:organic hydroperoxide reductase OsmC/OhrA
MAEPRAKVLEFAAAVEPNGRVEALGESVLPPAGWEAEHLVLAGLVRCSLKSLRYHARRAGIELTASGAATGTVTKRDADGRYAFVEIECRLDVELTAAPDDVPALLAKAERDCFVGNSLTAKPRYVWNVTLPAPERA